MSNPVWFKNKAARGLCAACGKSTKLSIHQDCGAKLIATRTVSKTRAKKVTPRQQDYLSKVGGS